MDSNLPMESVVRFSLKQRVFYNLLFVILSVGGVFALFHVPAEQYPNISFGEVIVATFFPGASPAEVETTVTHRIEEAIESIEGVESISSKSLSERSIVRIKFVDGLDYGELYDEVRFKVLNILDELPAEVDPPRIWNAKVEDFVPVIRVSLGGDHENRALLLMARELKVAFMRIPGVEEVKIDGEYVREFHVYLDPAKLNALGISFDDAAQALQNANVAIPAGDFRDKAGEFLIKVDQKFRSVEQVTSTIVRSDADGSFVRIEDVMSDAKPGYRDPVVISSVNGRNALSLKIIKSPKGNSLDIKSSVERVVEDFQPVAEREGLDIILTQDSTVAIKDGLTTLGSNLLVGVVLVSLIVWYIMGFRNACLVTIGIPFALLVTMLLVYVTGNSLNELTLFSFVLVTGIIVDDAIVVTENIYRHVQEGKEIGAAIVKGTAEVAMPVVSATMTTVAAFLPLLIMTGTTGDFFELIPKAVTIAMVASLVECLVILPIHYLDFGPRSGAERSIEKEAWLMIWLRRWTERILTLTLRFPTTSLLVVTIAFVAAAIVFWVSMSGIKPLIRIQFFPDDYSFYYVDVIGPAGTPIEEVDSKVRSISRYVADERPGLSASAAGFAGFYIGDDYEAVFGNNYGTVVVTLPPKQERGFDDPLVHLDNVRSTLKPLFEKDGFRLRIHAHQFGPRRGTDLNIRVLGSNLQSIKALAGDLFRFLHDDPDIGPYLVELQDDLGQKERVVRFKVLQEQVHEYGLDNTRVARLAASVLDGRYIGKYRLQDEEVDLKLYIDTDRLSEPEDALYIPLVEHATRPIRLADLVELETYFEVGELNRYQGERAISITANIKPKAPTSIRAVVHALKDYYETIRGNFPGATVRFEGSYEETQRSYQSLAYAFFIAIGIIFMILATQFQSYLQPLMILSAIVFAVIGVVFGKWLSQSLFTVNSLIALVGVAGVAVNDALVLIDFMNKCYRAGATRREAIQEGVRVRLRPIVLTTLTTTLGLLPMALGIPSYSLVWGSMATTFVTGLATATILTLFVIPILWERIQLIREYRAQ